MNTKLVASLLLVGFTLLPLIGCDGHAGGVPDAPQSEREKYKEMKRQAEADAAEYKLDPNAS